MLPTSQSPPTVAHKALRCGTPLGYEGFGYSVSGGSASLVILHKSPFDLGEFA